MDQERHGLRFLFTAAAEVAPESKPGATVATRVAELSLYGCYVESPAPFDANTPVLVKIFKRNRVLRGQGNSDLCKTDLGYGSGVSGGEAQFSCRFAEVDSCRNA